MRKLFYNPFSNFFYILLNNINSIFSFNSVVFIRSQVYMLMGAVILLICLGGNFGKSFNNIFINDIYQKNLMTTYSEERLADDKNLRNWTERRNFKDGGDSTDLVQYQTFRNNAYNAYSYKLKTSFTFIVIFIILTLILMESLVTLCRILNEKISDKSAKYFESDEFNTKAIKYLEKTIKKYNN